MEGESAPQSPALPPQVAQAVQSASAKLAADGRRAGIEAFEAIENSSLSKAEKQQAFCAVVEGVVADGCRSAREGVGVLRDNTAGTQFMSAFMAQYASDYISAVGHQTLEAIQNIQLPREGISSTDRRTALNHENTPKIGFRDDPEGQLHRQTMSSDAVAKWDDVYLQASMAAVNAFETQLPKLSPEAQKFLETCGNTARTTLPGEQGENAAVMIMANTVGLRGAFKSSATDGSGLQNAGATSLEQSQGRILTGASAAGQTYANLLMRDMPEGDRKAQNIIVAQLREQPGLLEQSRTVMTNLSRGIVPDTPKNELAPADVTSRLNAAIPGREQSIATGRGVIPVRIPVETVDLDTAEKQGQSAGRRSVREMLNSAKKAVTQKLGLDTESKLKRADKQISKRENHIADLKAERAALQTLMDSADFKKTIAKPYDPDKATRGDLNERNEQMKIAEARETQKQAGKLDSRIKNNEKRCNELKGDRAKLKFKSDSHQPAAKAGHASAVK